ncbi:MAG: metallopeptidase family protein [Labilithrix sp.]|nr:metallopeptidase family protein [Labilithrix sp.]MCW5834780.1 metallopeptidase family protein [Labilithrix sp.]
MAFALPRTLTLPSGARVTLRRRASTPVTATAPAPGAPLFSDVLALFERDVAIAEGTSEIDVHDLPLADFHVVRALLVKAGLVHEDEVTIDCHNCGASIAVRPCAGLETGPWEDGELDDPELDRTAELGVPLEIAPIRLGRVREARTITLAPRTVREASPLWAALTRPGFVLDEAAVDALGIVEIGPIRGARRVARALADGGDAALDAIADVWLAAHYPLRLACDVFCPKCRARNTVDAPVERELDLEARGRGALDDDREHEALPPLAEFVELAHAIADPLIDDIPGEAVELIVEAGTPEVDDGGEPLLGCYLPPPPSGAPVPTRPPRVTVFYQTFARIEREEGPFDWEEELRETIRHELEHHLYYLRGDDPMDDEERAEIAREVVRVVGRGEATRRTLAVLGRSVPDFFRRAWPLVAVGALALAIGLAERCQ